MSTDALPPTPVIRSVVFDLDGLMIDTEPLFVEVAQRLLSRRGRAVVPRLLRDVMGTPARDALQIFRDHYGLPESVEELKVECAGLFFAVLGEQPVRLMPGLLGLLDRLERRGLPKAIATSSRGDYVARVLAPHRLLPRFDFVLTADDVTRGKPCPEVYEKAAARFGHAPAKMLVLEDSVNGLRAAKAAGAHCVVVPHDLVPREELAAADAVVESLASPRLAELLRLPPAAT